MKSDSKVPVGYGSLFVRLPQWLLDELAIHCARTRRTRGEVIGELLAAKLLKVNKPKSEAK